MDNFNLQQGTKSIQRGPHLHAWPLTGKIWATMIIVMMSLGLIVALGQTVVHDIIPTFQDRGKDLFMQDDDSEKHSDIHGDLLSDTPAEKKATPYYQTDAFIFALKFTHIHIFGMSAIFIIMGFFVIFLDLGQKTRILLIVLPFTGIIIDLVSVWLKLFVHPVFFWLHIPGGVLFSMVFGTQTHTNDKFKSML